MRAHDTIDIEINRSSGFRDPRFVIKFYIEAPVFPADRFSHCRKRFHRELLSRPLENPSAFLLIKTPSPSPLSLRCPIRVLINSCIERSPARGGNCRKISSARRYAYYVEEGRPATGSIMIMRM